MLRASRIQLAFSLFWAITCRADFGGMYLFFVAYVLQMGYRIVRRDAFEVEDLATGKNGGQDLMLFRGRQDKRWHRGGGSSSVLRNALKAEELSMCTSIDDIDLVFSGLWCKTYLFHQGADIIHRIVAGGIQFMDVQGTAFIERDTGMAAVTGFPHLRLHSRN